MVINSSAWFNRQHHEEHSTSLVSEPSPAIPYGRRSGRAWTGLSVFLLLLSLYVLNVGPAVRLVEEERLPQEVIYLYEPLRAACLSCDPLTKALRSYVDLWRK